MRVYSGFLIGALLLFQATGAPAGQGSPQGRWGHLFVYFPPADSFVLFGGASERGAYREDMWQWDGRAWQQINVQTPSARGFSAAAYDPVRETILLHGGRGNDRETFSDLWEWDGSAWHQLDAEGPYPSDHHEMVYLPEEEGIFLFGGWTGEGVSGQSWLWNGAWTLLAKAEGAGPPPRSAFGMTYNRARHRVELFGGLWINGQYADAWAWSRGQWQRLSGPYDNSSLDHLTMFFDEALGEPLIFGGKDYRYRMRGETRRLTSAGLVETISETGPTPRHSVTVAYDRKRNRGVLFGGKIYEGDRQLPLDDMWLWENGSWRPLSGSDDVE